MIEAGSGAMVNVASMAGLTGLYDAHAYTAAKGALINLSRSMGITYCKQGVRTNSVCPGFVDTPMIAPVISSSTTPQSPAPWRRWVARHGRRRSPTRSCSWPPTRRAT